jgi:hypothetical protein
MHAGRVLPAGARQRGRQAGSRAGRQKVSGQCCAINNGWAHAAMAAGHFNGAGSRVVKAAGDCTLMRHVEAAQPIRHTAFTPKQPSLTYSAASPPALRCVRRSQPAGIRHRFAAAGGSSGRVM